ncbi:hypothetical protein UlMin_026325 [Ulmus minor]
MLTKPFLDVYKNLLHVLAALVTVKLDVGNNISVRYINIYSSLILLDSKYLSDPIEFNLFYSLVRPKIEAKTAKACTSCTNALLWLTIAMDYMVELFRSLEENPDWKMSQACNDSYNKTLKKWHGWLISSSFFRFIVIILPLLSYQKKKKRVKITKGMDFEA